MSGRGFTLRVAVISTAPQPVSAVWHLIPGPTSLYLELTLPRRQKETGYRAATVENAASATLYDYSVTADLSGEAPVVECVVASEKILRHSDRRLHLGRSPRHHPARLDSRKQLHPAEGENPPSPVTADIVAQAPLCTPLSHRQPAYLNANGFPRSVTCSIFPKRTGRHSPHSVSGGRAREPWEAWISPPVGKPCLSQRGPVTHRNRTHGRGQSGQGG